MKVIEAAEAMAAQATAIAVRGVSKTFGAGPTATRALDNIDLDVPKGAFVSLIGSSGCGKSTLLSLVADLERDYEGEILVHGKPPREARLGREYGIVFQEPALLDWRRVIENVGLPLEIQGVNRWERRAHAQDMLTLVGLEGFERHYPWQLSGGMQQRVAIARALVFRPKLLLMDEPFGALDEITRERMDIELLRIYQETGTSILFVTHSIAEAVFLSTEVVVLSGRPGRVVERVAAGLTYPRTAETREEPRFHQHVARVRHALSLSS